ncbi:unnamed protein product [Amoebophrya sp. A120]|nr:unnamed protein product [Amoebophrya sp. A120]|eukprot:GSA120T00014366001.1
MLLIWARANNNCPLWSQTSASCNNLILYFGENTFAQRAQPLAFTSSYKLQSSQSSDNSNSSSLSFHIVN